MYYVYLLESISHPGKRYIGFTSNLKNRFRSHNDNGSVHAAKYKPWKLVAYFAFGDEEHARAFEFYLKSGSGSAFAKRHFW